ncbi:MAG: hypothetical protein PHH60_01435 [Candidatus Margulisbacteria bacterium]|nr:hypothetical protein [Candidatus Margulisiibacteriota bacterium]
MRYKIVSALLAVRNAARRLGVIDDPAVIKARGDIIEIITRLGTIRPGQEMMVRLPSWPGDPQKCPVMFVEAMDQLSQADFGTNQRFIDELVYLLNKRPEQIAACLFRLARAFTLAKEMDFSFRELIPALYIWMSDRQVSDIPANPGRLAPFLEDVCRMMERGTDPVEELMYEAQAKKYNLPAS